MKKLLKVDSSIFKELEGAPGESITVTGIAEGGKSDEAELYSIPGIMSRPEGDEICVVLEIGEQKIAIATQNYETGKTVDKGEVLIYSILDGTVKGEIYVKKDGLVSIKNENETLKTLIGDLIDAIAGIGTTGSPAVHIVDAASQASLNAIKSRFDTLFSD